jgi:hypothetical protein
VLRVIRHNSPTTSQRLHADLSAKRLIPDGFSTSSILAAAGVLGKQIDIYAEHGLISSRPLLVTPERIGATARRLIEHWGASTVDELCARLREETSLEVPVDLARLLLEAQDDFCWLDQRR